MIKFARQVMIIFALIFLGPLALSADKLADAKGAGGESRAALVIGNTAYPSGALANPKNDATAVASALKKWVSMST